MTNKPMLSVERSLLERVVDNRYREKEQISIARHEALWELRALLDKEVDEDSHAPKRQGEPVALQHMAVSEGGVLRWMTGRNMQDCELYAMPDGSAIRSKLYAEQPAPVAVVMPEHTMRSVMDAIQQARGFPVLTSNQCHALAESINYVARLNGVKP